MMEWNVFYHNVNADRIETFNVFRHGGLVADIASLVKKRKNKEEFAEGLRRSVMYYFWSKCEWEVLISPWCGSRSNKPIKVDVYWQIMNNWDIFLEYTWEHRKDLTKLEE
jgi:hypothetical protein